ncbi:MAG: hypothetical protein V3U65_18250, partial [Granulosicoccaceae bacterium]
MKVGIITAFIGALLMSSCAVVPTDKSTPTAPGDVVVENLTIASSLTGQAGDAAEGRKIFANRKQGNCLAC